MVQKGKNGWHADSLRFTPSSYVPPRLAFEGRVRPLFLIASPLFSERSHKARRRDQCPHRFEEDKRHEPDEVRRIARHRSADGIQRRVKPALRSQQLQKVEKECDEKERDAGKADDSREPFVSHIGQSELRSCLKRTTEVN